jgi:ATP/ADP translocase
MLAFVSWNLYKYKLNASDKFFIFALCMYPFAYLFLMIGAILYLLEDRLYDDEVYSFINLSILPFNYLVMWSIELMLTFEM